MLEELLRLQSEGKWSEMLAFASSASSLVGEDLAAAYRCLSNAYSRTARCGNDWRTALRYAHLCRGSAPPNSPLYFWSLVKIATLAQDMGRSAETEVYASVYLRTAPVSPDSAHLRAWAIRALSHVAYQRGQYRKAVALRRQARLMFAAAGTVDEVERTTLNIVWALARMGSTHSARAELSSATSRGYLYHGSVAVVLMTEGHWKEALSEARVAMKGDRLVHDYADAAELHLIAAHSLTRLHQDAQREVRFAVEYAARQCRQAETLLALTRRAGGGDSLNEETSRGSGGYHPDSVFTTGVA